MKRVISFVLVLALVLGSFSMAFASTATNLTDIEGNPNEEAITVANDLGIITGYGDNSYKPTQAVTRAEYAAMIVRALAIPESALAGYTTTSFKDTSGYGWAVKYLAFCNDKGIMLGDGQGNAMPGRTIDTNEAVTMILRAIGYTNNSAVLVGNYPANYVTLAQTLKLYDDVTSTGLVDRATAAQIIYNALDVRLVQVNSDGETNYVTGNPTLLTAGLDCYEAGAKVITGDENSIINLASYKGTYAVAYRNQDHEIVAIKEVKSTQLTGDYDVSEGVLTVGDVEYNLSASETPVSPGGLLINNGYCEVTTTAIGTLVQADREITVNVELDGKNIDALYSVVLWNVSAAKQVNASNLKEITQNNALLGAEFVLDDDDAIDTDTFELIGAASLDKIAEDDVVYIYTYAGGTNVGKISRVAVGTEVVEGTVTKIDGTEFTVGNKVYENTTAANTGAGTKLADSNLGDEVKLFLDAYGEIYTSEVISGSVDTYGIIIATQAGIDHQAKIFDSTGNEKTYVAKNATIGSDLVNLPAATLFKFTVNKDGKIDSVTTGSINSYVTTTVSAVFVTDRIVSAAGTSYAIDKDVIVFVEDGGDYEIKAITDIKKDEAVGANLFFNTDGDVVAIVVAAADANASADDVYGVINTKVATMNGDDKAFELKGFAGTDKLEKLTADNSGTYNGVATTGASIASAQLVKIELNADGSIVKTDVKAETTSGTAASSTTDYINVSGGGMVAVDANTVYYLYNRTDGEYSVFFGEILAGYTFKAYNTDTDTNAAEYVIVMK